MDIAVIHQLPAHALHGKRVLVRIDVDGGEFAVRGRFSPSRLQACLPTLEYLLRMEARVILAAHLGPPSGRRDEALGLEPLAQQLERLLDRPVRKLGEAVGEEVFRAVMDSKPQDVVLLENLSFYPGETANDPGFARQLGSLAEVYCNDAFALASRALASTVGITRCVPVSVAGLELAREVSMIEGVIGCPEPPFIALIAGARMEEKLPILERLLPKVNRLFIGGALCFTFLKAQGHEVGAAPLDEAFLPLVEDFLAKAAGKTEIILPSDFIAVDRQDWLRFEAAGRQGTPPAAQTVRLAELRPSQMPVDLGPLTLRRVEALVIQAHTLLWNGPLGIWEVEPFAAGTRRIAQVVTTRSGAGFRGILCGDSLAQATHSFDLPFEQLRHMTPAGEATLQLLAGRPLPALEALMKQAELAAAPFRRPRKILLPVDGSARSLEAVRKAVMLVATEGAEIHLLYIQKPPLFSTADTWVDPEEQRRRAVERRLEGERVFALSNAVLARNGVISHRQLMTEGDPADRILDYAEQTGADLIAVGCRGVAGPLRPLLGDISRKIVDRAKCPVLLIRVPDDEAVRAGLEEA
jgi:phosphoglycerate kinase